MEDLFTTNRMSHLLHFYDDFFQWKFSFKNSMFHSAVIYTPKVWKRDEIMNQVATDIDGYLLSLLFLFEVAYFDDAVLILNC